MKWYRAILLFSFTAAGFGQSPTYSTLPLNMSAPVWEMYISAGDGSIEMPKPTIGKDGHKVYTITTSSDWTCIPAGGSGRAVVITCVKSDTPKPSAVPASPKMAPPVAKESR